MHSTDALKAVEVTMGRPCKKISFDQRAIGGNEICVLFFSCQYQGDGLPLHTEHRISVFVDGKERSGCII